MNKTSPKELFEKYKNRFPYFEEYESDTPAEKDTRFRIVIPCHHEPNLIDTLNSLLKCEQPKAHFEVIIVAPEFNQSTAKLIAKQSGLNVITISPLNPKWSENLIKLAKAIANK